MIKSNKHENYEVLNLIGYGLAKFNSDFIKSFGFKTKTAFYNYIVEQGIAETVGTVKNRQDLFDAFFDNIRKGWWQKGNAYIHRKINIDLMFGTLGAEEYASIVKIYLTEKYAIAPEIKKEISPVLKSKFKQLQTTGQEAELYFMSNYKTIDIFTYGNLEDARIFGDGYDFQISVANNYFLTEIKGLRTDYGSIRMTQNEYEKAREYKDKYALIVVSNLIAIPIMNTFFDPISKIDFTETIVNTKQYIYHSNARKWC